MAQSFFAHYQKLVDGKVLKPDPAQAEIVRQFDELARQLQAHQQDKPNFFQRLMGQSHADDAPDGLYIWGDVGRGKTMLMDLFFNHIEVEKKRRVHFHEFMAEVHEAIAEFRKSEKGKDNGRRDPIPHVTAPIIDEVKLLCFDEFHVNDITDAMLLSRLFDQLFAAGLVVVATSNVPPDRLYKNGLNRQLFVPFIDLLKQKTKVLQLDVDHDYRREKLEEQPIYFFGHDEASRKGLDRVWNNLTGRQAGEPEVINLQGRSFEVPQQALGVMRIGFKQLCEAPLGSRDYLRLSHHYHTFIIDEIPYLDRARSDAAKRFILLVDTLYDRGCKLAASFAAPLEELSGDDQTAFEFQRTLSRLMEMRSLEYLGAPLNDVEDAEERSA
ncbi:cell division protein ZapE [Maritalea mediterranea]|uniref:AFG1 family ATPase n=1 Tax=Maritalea mediterranea TaxID=2909667 RepID=A0ABS9EF21_9HYPH|nr:cell division protein ZapE [Maritalea mediterranea]MCF4100008.1 AFG1 family ATPase [Maritalea mediterranea]